MLVIRGGIKRGIKAAAVPGSVTFAAEQHAVGVLPSMNVAVGAWFFVKALFLGGTAVAGSVGSEPVGATAEAGNGAAVGVGDTVITEVGLGRGWEGRADGVVVGTLASGTRWVGGGLLALEKGRPLNCSPVLKCCRPGSVGVDGGKFLNGGARDANGGKVAAQGAQASVVATSLKREGFKKGMAGHSALRQVGKANEKVGGQAVPGDRQGWAPKLSIGGGSECGGVHASNASQEIAVEDLCCCSGLGGARGQGPDFAAVGKDGGDE